MLKKTLILRIGGTIISFLGLFIIIVIVPFVSYITRGDVSRFVRRFGTESEGTLETYKNLYQMAYIFAESANKNILFFNMSVGISLLTIGIVLFLWGRDLKRCREMSKH